MNRGRQSMLYAKKSGKRKIEVQPTTKRKEAQKESQMEEQLIPEQLSLELEKPIQPIDDAFKVLDRVSRTLNDATTRGIANDLLDALAAVFERGKEKLSLEELHNLQYSNRLSYIIDVAQRKCPKGKNISQLIKMAEAEIERIEHLYQQYFADFTFLEEIRKQYMSNVSQL